MSCPICSNTELNEGTDNCPKCGSDLEIFTHIESAHKENAFQRKSILVLITLFGTVLVSWGSVSLFSGAKTDVSESIALVDSTSVAAPAMDSNALTASSTSVDAFVKGTEEVKPEVAPIKSEAEVKVPVEKVAPVKAKAKVKAPAVSNEGGVIIHTVKRGDSFWTISKKYFRTGKHAKRIATDNNLNPKKSIPLGTKLKINK